MSGNGLDKAWHAAGIRRAVATLSTESCPIPVKELKRRETLRSRDDPELRRRETYGAIERRVLAALVTNEVTTADRVHRRSDTLAEPRQQSEFDVEVIQSRPHHRPEKMPRDPRSHDQRSDGRIVGYSDDDAQRADLRVGAGFADHLERDLKAAGFRKISGRCFKRDRWQLWANPAGCLVSYSHRGQRLLRYHIVAGIRLAHLESVETYFPTWDSAYGYAEFTCDGLAADYAAAEFTHTYRVLTSVADLLSVWSVYALDRLRRTPAPWWYKWSIQRFVHEVRESPTMRGFIGNGKQYTERKTLQVDQSASARPEVSHERIPRD